MPFYPSWQLVRQQVVFVVLAQFLQRGASHIDELDFQFHRSDAVGHSLHNVLLARTGCLHHLVNGAVAILGQKPLAEHVGQLIEHHGFLVEMQRLPVLLAPQYGVYHGSGFQCTILIWTRSFHNSYTLISLIFNSPDIKRGRRVSRREEREIISIPFFFVISIILLK